MIAQGERVKRALPWVRNRKDDKPWRGEREPATTEGNQRISQGGARDIHGNLVARVFRPFQGPQQGLSYFWIRYPGRRCPCPGLSSVGLSALCGQSRAPLKTLALS